MSVKPFKNIDEQIEILKNRNLLFLNEESAKVNLKRYGYYEIINGYKKPFLKNPNNDNDGFKEYTTFEHIYALYNLDKNFRTAVIASLEDFEQNFRQVLSYTISEKISDNQDKYLAKSHYNTGKYKTYKKHGKSVKESDRDKTLRCLNKYSSARITKDSYCLNYPDGHFINLWNYGYVKGTDKKFSWQMSKKWKHKQRKYFIYNNVGYRTKINKTKWIVTCIPLYTGNKSNYYDEAETFTCHYEKVNSKKQLVLFEANTQGRVIHQWFRSRKIAKKYSRHRFNDMRYWKSAF